MRAAKKEQQIFAEFKKHYSPFSPNWCPSSTAEASKGTIANSIFDPILPDGFPGGYFLLFAFIHHHGFLSEFSVAAIPSPSPHFCQILAIR
jgi:hypothetical protein